MICPEQGELRAYADGELDAEWRRAVAEHLAVCHRCQLSLEEIEKNALLATNLLGMIESSDAVPTPNPLIALARCQQELLTNRGLWDRIQEGGQRIVISFKNNTWRLAAAAVAVCLCLMALMVSEPIRLAAEDFLGVFRVERFTAVAVDPNNLPDVPSPSELGTFTMPEQPKMHNVSSRAEAQALVGFALADLSNSPLENAPYTVSEGMQFSFAFDAQKVEAYLAARGISSMVLPKNLDGVTIKVNVPPIVTVGAGLSPTDGAALRRHMTFVQTTSPTLEVPPDFDVELIRSQLLRSGLLPPDLASQLAAIRDWRKTAVIPVPADAARSDVDVAGAPGLLVSGDKYGAGVFWKRNDVIYGLTASTGFSGEDLLGIARSIK